MEALWTVFRLDSGGSLTHGYTNEPCFRGVYTTEEGARQACLEEFRGFEFDHWRQWCIWKMYPAKIDTPAEYAKGFVSGANLVGGVRVCGNEPKPSGYLNDAYQAGILAERSRKR